MGLGLKQVEPLSPILFLLFVNDINDSIDFNNLTEHDMNRLSIFSLLFADDLALFTTDKHSLQAQLDSIHLYSTRWELAINVAKTKICVFEKCEQRHNLEWFINNNNIEEVENFTYLVKLVKNINFCSEALNEQALRAFNTLLFVCKNVLST